MSDMQVPEDNILLRALQATFTGTIKAAEEFRTLSEFLVDAGAGVTDEDLNAFYQFYLQLRQDLYTHFVADIGEADEVYKAVVLAIQRGEVAVKPPEGQTSPDPLFNLLTPKAKTSRPAQVSGGQSGSWQAVSEMAQDAIDMLEDAPSAAKDYAEGVTPKLESMREWIEQHQRVTDKLKASVERMHEGALRWCEND